MSNKTPSTNTNKESKQNNKSATGTEKLNLWLNKIGKALNTHQQSNYK